MPLDEEQMTEYMSAKSAFQKRLKAEGRYDQEFIPMKIRKVAEGMDAHTVYVLAMQDPEWAPLVEEDGDDLPYDVDPEIFEGKTCEQEEAVRWAWGKRFVRCIGPRDAPSDEAWTSLYDAKRSKEGMARLARAWTSLLPKQAEIEKRQQAEASEEKFTEGLKKIADTGLAVTEDGHAAPLGRIRPVLERPKQAPA